MSSADLQAHRGAEPAAGQLALERLQQVLVAVLLDLDVGVAGDPEDVVRDDLEAREQLRQVGADELLERQVAGRRPCRARGRSACTLLGTLTRAKCSTPVAGSRTSTARLSDSPLMYGNGCAGSTASGVSTGNTCARK